MGKFTGKAQLASLEDHELRHFWNDSQQEFPKLTYDENDRKLMNDEFSRRKIPRSLRTFTPIVGSRLQTENRLTRPESRPINYTQPGGGYTLQDLERARTDTQLQHQIIEAVCRSAYRLNGKATFRMVLTDLNGAKGVLEVLFPGTWEKHPVIQYLILKLANISCPKRDTDYYQIENIVRDLAHIE